LVEALFPEVGDLGCRSFQVTPVHPSRLRLRATAVVFPYPV